MDKVTVDDALISTDVDQLIRTISERKRVGLRELEKSCSIESKTIDKWLKVLEEEGYITIEYGLTDTYVVWLGLSEDDVEERDDAVVRSSVEETSPAVGLIPSQVKNSEAYKEENQRDEYNTNTVPLQSQTKADEAKVAVEEVGSLKNNILEKLEGKSDEHTNYLPSSTSAEPALLSRNSLLSEEIKEFSADTTKFHGLNKADERSSTAEQSGWQKTEPSENSLDVRKFQDLRTASERSSLDEERKTLMKAEIDELLEKALLAPSKSSSSMPDDLDNIQVNKNDSFYSAHDEKAMSHGRTTSERFVMPRASNVQVPQPMTNSSTKDLKEIVNAYLEEINKEKADIEQLKRKKERIYREKILALESKIEADIVSITERILDKEGRMLELKERVLELPDKIEAVDQLHRSMERLQRESRASLEAMKSKTEDYLANLDDSEEEIRGKIEEHREVIRNESKKIEELEKLGTSVDSKLTRTSQNLDSVKSQVDELNTAMQTMLNDLEEATEMKVKIAEMAGQVREAVDAREQELTSLEAQLGQIRQVEQWTKEYLVDYEKKIGDIEQYVLQSNDELSNLREVAEAEYIKKYLGELESMTQTYEHNINEAVQAEKDVDESISSSKKRLNDLVQESQQMIKKLRSDVAGISVFEDSVEHAKAKMQKIHALVEEKEQESEKLREDYSKARSGRIQNTAKKSVKKSGKKKGKKK